jgi:hypothetical protein
LPGSLWAAVALLGLVPGWIFLVRREKYLRSAPRSGLGELLQVASVGLGLTGAAIVIWSVVAEAIAPFGFISLDEWARYGASYLGSYPRHLVLTVALVLSTACGLAWLLALGIYRSLRAAYQPGSPWEQAFSGVPEGKALWLGLKMQDGPLIEGLLHNFDVAEASEGNRDIVLTRPIYVTEKETRERTDLERLVVSSEHITYVSAVHMSVPSEEAG